jgi:hypothetical protein
VALNTGTAFADAACAQPALSVDCGQRFATTPPRYSDDCGDMVRFFEIAGPFSPNDLHYGSPDLCYAAGDPLRDGVEWHALGSEIPLASLVTATIEIPSGDGARIRPARLRADDGASQQVFAWDTARGEPVSLPAWWYPDAPGSRWEPQSPAWNSPGGPFFADADCSQSVVATQGCGDAIGRSIAEHAGNTCADIPSGYRELGAPVDPGTLYEINNGFCARATTPLTPGGNSSFFLPGALIPPETFADARVIDEGTSRILLRQPGSTDGPIDIGSGRFVDTRYQQVCEPRTAADGSLRCLPTAGSYLADLYADAACTIPIASEEGALPDCPAKAAPSVVSMRQPVTDSCGRSDRYRAYQIAGPHVGALYYFFNGICADSSDLASVVPVYDLGPELPPDAFESIATSEHYPAW